MGKHPLYNQSGLQKNNKSHVLYALANKQMELKQIQDEYEAKMLKINIDLQALETAMCLFDGDCGKTIKKLNAKTANSTKRIRKTYFKSGEAMKLILKTLREADEALYFQDLLQLIWYTKSKEVGEDEKGNFAKSLSVSLNSIYKKGLLSKVMIKNKAMWSIESIKS